MADTVSVVAGMTMVTAAGEFAAGRTYVVDRGKPGVEGLIEGGYLRIVSEEVSDGPDDSGRDVPVSGDSGRGGSSPQTPRRGRPRRTAGQVSGEQGSVESGSGDSGVSAADVASGDAGGASSGGGGQAAGTSG